MTESSNDNLKPDETTISADDYDKRSYNLNDKKVKKLNLNSDLPDIRNKDLSH